VSARARGVRTLVSGIAVLAAYGWLDLLRRLPGPHLSLVLPLRANGGGDDVSVLTVVLVWSATFAAIARILPPAADALLRTIVVRAALLAVFVVTVVALQHGIVEQARPTFSWSRAIELAWSWIACACAALGTWLGAPRHARSTVPARAETSESRTLEASVA
jgi:hypothetical protein